MCLLVYPNGHDEGLGTHVSIFTTMMRGPYDGVLKWPFQGEVTIQILNQVGKHNHQQQIISYSEWTPECCAGRVNNGERSLALGSTGRGSFKFLSHRLLGYNAARNTQYLRGDSLRIGIFEVELKSE